MPDVVTYLFRSAVEIISAATALAGSAATGLIDPALPGNAAAHFNHATIRKKIAAPTIISHAATLMMRAVGLMICLITMITSATTMIICAA